MLKEFKARYPQGRFTTQVIFASNNKYIVRTILLVNLGKKAEAVGEGETKKIAEGVAIEKAMAILDKEA